VVNRATDRGGESRESSEEIQQKIDVIVRAEKRRKKPFRILAGGFV